MAGYPNQPPKTHHSQQKVSTTVTTKNSIFSMSTMAGGTTAPRPATAEDQTLVEKVKADLEAKTNKKYGTFVAKEKASQVVAGTMHYVKVDAGDEHVHLKIYEHFSGTVQLNNYQTGKTAADVIGYF